MATSVVSLIVADMTGPSQGSPHGWPYSTDPQNNGLNPSDSQALDWWSDLYVDAAGNPATNSRIAIRNVQLWWFNTSTNQWIGGLGPAWDSSFDGGYYNEDFSGAQLSNISLSTEADGSHSYGTTQGEVAHTFAPFPRVPTTPANFGGLVVSVEAVLVLINPTGTDDRASAKLLYQVGADGYPSTTGPGIENNPGITASKFKYVTTSWQFFGASTMSEAQLTANPPPITLGPGASGSSGGTSGGGSVGGSGSSGGTGTGSGGSGGTIGGTTGGSNSSGAPVISFFTAVPNVVVSSPFGQGSRLLWQVDGANSIVIDQGIGDVTTHSTRDVSVTEYKIYTLTATNSSGTSTAQAIVALTTSALPIPVINSFVGMPASSTTVTLTWNVTGASVLSLNNGVGVVSGSSLTVSVPVTTTYVLTATNSVGSAVASVSITVGR
jgi:hypothetical protein